MCEEQAFSLSVVWEKERERVRWVYEGSCLGEESVRSGGVVWRWSFKQG